MMLESDAEETKESHQNEVAALHKELDQTKSRLSEIQKRRKHSESSDNQDEEDDEEYIEELLNKIDSLEDELEQQKEK